MYTNVQHAVYLDEDPEWRDAKRTAARLEKETPANPPPPISREAMLASRAQLRRNPTADLYLAMLWAFAARAGDVSGLNAEDVKIDATPDGSHTARVALTIRRGKGAKRSGPYIAASTMEDSDARELQRLVQQTSTGQRIFRTTAQIRAAVRAALKQWDARAALPSLRSGAARHLAATGMPEADLARLLGHRSIDTLRRYLGYAENLTIDTRRTQRGTRLLHAPAGPELPKEAATARASGVDAPQSLTS
jgi:integrase